MGFFKSFGKGLGKSWEVKRWLEYDHLKGNAYMIRNLWNNVITDKTELGDDYKDFSQAQKKLEISEESLSKIAKRFKIHSYLMLVVTLSIMTYAAILLFSNSLLPALSCVMLSLLALSVTFRESYNYYLVTTRRLKSTPNQWLKFIIKKGVK
ncbi:MAG: hypothetical protein ABGY11_03615 [Candidatus Thioglobus sp.]